VTLIELMIAMSLAAVMSAFMLMLTRGQLISYEMSDQLTRAQQNARSGIDFMESTLRRACTGAPTGRLLVMNATANFAEGGILPCVRFTNSQTAADQIEVYYGGPPCDTTACNYKLIQTTVAPTWGTNMTLTVNDASNFQANDYVMISAYNDAIIYQVQSAPVAGSTTLALKSTASAPSAYASAWQPLAYLGQASGDPSQYNAGSYTVMKLYGYRFYLDTTTGSPTKNMLMVDGGELGNFSQFGNAGAQALVDAIEDFQIAIGNDKDNNGTILEVPAAPGTDEWIGNNPATLETLTDPGPNDTGGKPAWGAIGDVLSTFPRAFRVSLLVKTTNLYPGTPNLPTAIEDRSSWTVAPTDISGPRLRLIRTLVSPRVWNPKI
jgi:hypothetical protein